MPSFKKVLYAASRASLRELTEEETARLRKILLQTYQDVDRVCRKHGLTLMLCGGSLLGAVRHKGFIPWDDDLDAALTRKDYDTLARVFDAELGDRYILNAPNRGMISKSRFPQILVKGTRLLEIGARPEDDRNKIKMDLFIVENCPNTRFGRLLHGAWCSLLMLIAAAVGTYNSRNTELRDCLSSTTAGRNFYRRRRWIGRLFSFRTRQQWVDSVDNACNYHKQGKFMGIPTGRGHYFGEVLPSSVFCPPKAALFEGIPVHVFADSGRYLANLYGKNYMTIPPPEKREKHFIMDIAFSTDNR